jgi:hypothetical protein
MLLPRGVTGIWGREDGPTSFSDYPAFRGHCYDVARRLGASVRLVLTPRQAIACNYALAQFRLRDAEVAAVLNGVHPFLAFAAPPTDGQVRLDFADCPELAAEFDRIGGYALLAFAEVSKPLTQKMCDELAHHEQKRVRYFRPPRVGDVIFNHWD